MNIFVISDTHGHLEKAYDMYNKISQTDKIDAIIHCGDYQRDGGLVESTLGIPVTSVQGNCDGTRQRDFKVVETPAGKILVTHGHIENVDYNYNNLLYLAQENDCICVCFGHTHFPVIEKEQGITLVNPGSLTFPRDGTNGSCALLHLTENLVDGLIIYYDESFGNNKKKKARGGYLRGLLNYSDRF
jgi:phosphoesterase, MJ0936 family